MMQDKEDKNWIKEHMEDIDSKNWNYDFASLSNSEISFILKNIFYQLFLIHVDKIEINSSLDYNGYKVNLSISGEAYRDPSSIENYEIDDYTEE